VIMSQLATYGRFNKRFCERPEQATSTAPAPHGESGSDSTDDSSVCSSG